MCSGVDHWEVPEAFSYCEITNDKQIQNMIVHTSTRREVHSAPGKSPVCHRNSAEQSGALKIVCGDCHGLVLMLKHREYGGGAERQKSAETLVFVPYTPHNFSSDADLALIDEVTRYRCTVESRTPEFSDIDTGNAFARRNLHLIPNIPGDPKTLGKAAAGSAAENRQFACMIAC